MGRHEQGGIDYRTFNRTPHNSPEHEDERKNHISKATEILERNALESARLANNIYTRSGVYLFIGTLIAVGGIILFSLQNTGLIELINNKEKVDFKDITVLLAPKMSILLFIEIIAFFFLKQYKFAMDEHRYFETIKRDRQRALAVTVLLQESDTQIKIEKYIKACGFDNQQYGKLKKGETTELLESKKITSDDLKLTKQLLSILKKIN